VKKIIVILACAFLILASCGMSKQDVMDTVKSSFQAEMNTGEYREYGIKVIEISLVKKSGREYDGIVTVSLDGKFHSVPIEVMVDGDSCLWQTKPGAFMFLGQKMMENIMDDYANTLKSLGL
jgi:hypothetical protein